MAEFPASPMAPSEFMEQWLPQAFAEAQLPPGSESVDVKLGVKLEGEGGGEWLFHVQNGKMSVAAASRDEAVFTYVQSVEDWRGALWEGRGGAVGEQAALMFRPGEQPPAGPGQMGAAGAPSPAALQQMQALDGVIRMVVAGGQGGDWKVDFKLGPGEIPEQPTTTVTLAHEDAVAVSQAPPEQRPGMMMQFFMSGRMQVTGDMALMMQMQAIQMQAAAQASVAAAGAGGSGSGGHA